MTTHTTTHPDVSKSIRFTAATFVLPGVNPKEFCKWASENFGVLCTRSGAVPDTYRVSPKWAGQDIWGALHDIHAHRDWVKAHPIVGKKGEGA